MFFRGHFLNFLNALSFHLETAMRLWPLIKYEGLLVLLCLRASTALLGRPDSSERKYYMGKSNCMGTGSLCGSKIISPGSGDFSTRNGPPALRDAPGLAE